MLLEALNFAATYAITPRKTATEINASVTLWARARRCARDWAQHEENSKAFVLKATDGLTRKRVAVVLGSGLLRDTPIEVLSQAFETVMLFDLQHIASIRAWAALKGLRNLRLIHRDLSGYQALKAGTAVEPLAFLNDIAGLDLVISANLLSQIGVGIGRMTKDQPQSPVPSLLQAHVDGLAALPVKACLLTDISYEVIDKSGTVLERDDLMRGIALPPAQAEWLWPVAPFGELDPTYQAVHRVVAITLP